MHTSPLQINPLSEPPPQYLGELAGSIAPVDSLRSHVACVFRRTRLPPPPPVLSLARGSSFFPPPGQAYTPATHLVYPHSFYRHPPHHPRAHPSHAKPSLPSRSLPPPRARATYLACVVRHTSTSSVGWIEAPVVPVAAGERGVQSELRSARVADSCGGWLEMGCVQWHSVSESGRVQNTATVFTPEPLHCQGWENGRLWVRVLAMRGSIIATMLLIARC